MRNAARVSRHTLVAGIKERWLWNEREVSHAEEGNEGGTGTDFSIDL
jgi:hypothetical protein